MSTDRIEALRTRLEKVRVQFERYFSGLEKRMPVRARDEIARDIRRFLPGNDGVQRFKHRNLIQRLIVLEQHWGRIIRAIEAGTFHREVARADYRMANRNQSTRDERSQEAPSQTESNEAAAFLEELGAEKAKPKIQMRGNRPSKSKPRSK